MENYTATDAVIMKLSDFVSKLSCFGPESVDENERVKTAPVQVESAAVLLTSTEKEIWPTTSHSLCVRSFI